MSVEGDGLSGMISVTQKFTAADTCSLFD